MLKKVVVVLVGCVVMGHSINTLQAEKSNASSLRGKEIFENACMMCHGITGEGNGPAAWFLGRYSSPRPRNFTNGNYKFRSTLSGELPTDQDLFRTITNGIPGYMPFFSGLSEMERWHVIAYIKTFSDAFTEKSPQALQFETQPFPSSSESIKRGRSIYVQQECWRCHGSEGQGNGDQSIEGNLEDADGLPIHATDLTSLASYKNGASARDVFRTLMTGLTGTPMPSYGESFVGQEEDLWHLVNYLLSLSQTPYP